MLQLPTQDNPDDEDAFKTIREAARLLHAKVHKA